MRARRRGWIMLREDIPPMLQMIEAKIASSEIEFQHRSALIRLRAILEEDLQDRTGDPAPQVSTVMANARKGGHQP
jgi:hypothetical protein